MNLSCPMYDVSPIQWEHYFKLPITPGGSGDGSGIFLPPSSPGWEKKLRIKWTEAHSMGRYFENDAIKGGLEPNGRIEWAKDPTQGDGEI